MKKLLTSAALSPVRRRPAHCRRRAAAELFALVPKNLNNPFFDQAKHGCDKAARRSGGKVECLFTGPGEHGGGDEQVQIVADLIAKGVDGIAVRRPTPRRWRALQAAKDAGIPVLTWDPTCCPRTRTARRLYRHAQLRHRRRPREAAPGDQAEGRHDLHPVGRRRGGQPQRAHAGHPRHARRQTGTQSPGERLTGQNGWTEVDGCPLYTNDDFPLSVQQMEDILGKYPDLDAFMPTGGFPQFVPDAYRAAVEPYKDKIADGALALVVADTLPVQIDLMKEGLSAGQVGQRPFEMGYKVMHALKDMKDGKPAPADPTYTGLDVCTPETADTCIAK